MTYIGNEDKSQKRGQGRIKLLSAAVKRFTAALHSYLTLCSTSPICL